MDEAMGIKQKISEKMEMEKNDYDSNRQNHH